MAIPTITLLPTAPTTADPVTFRARGDAFLSALNTLDDELNASIGGINTALPAIDVAVSNANFQGTWSSGTAYTVGQSVVLSGITYVAILAGTNQNPSTATMYWLPTGIPQLTHLATSKTTPVDADELALVDSEATFGLKKLTWANLKTTLGTLFAPLVSPAFTGIPTAPTATAGTNTTQLATTAFAMGAGIGANQTWQNLTASRALGVNYTNSSGKPIQVSVTMRMVTGQGVKLLNDSGETALISGNSATEIYQQITLTIANGGNYQLGIFAGAGGTIHNWWELR